MEHMNATCPRHGEYSDPSGRRHITECPDCQREAQRAHHDFRMRWGDYEHWWRCGIPARYRSRTLANWTPEGTAQQTAATAVQGYAERIRQRVEAGDGLTVLGPPGTGKTHLLTALVTAAHHAGIRGLYWSWPALIDEHRSSFKSPPDDPARRFMDNAATCPLLALDEIGHGTGTEWERLQLFELIDYRYREGLPILTASNATTKTLADLIGERLADRLREINAPVPIPGESQRARVKHDNTPAMDPPPESITITYHALGDMQEREITRPETRYSR